MAYGARLESVLGASPRGFESPILRHEIGPVTCDDAGDGPFGCRGVDGSPQRTVAVAVAVAEGVCCH